MMATECSSRSKDVCQIIKFAARKQVTDVCIVPNQSATDQKVVPLLSLRKNLDGSQGTLYRYALRVQIQNLNLASRNSQLHQREAILKRQRRNKRALQLPKRSANVLIFQRKLGPAQTSCFCRAELNSGMKFDKSTAEARRLNQTFQLSSASDSNVMLLPR